MSTMTSGRVAFSTSLQPSWPSKSARVASLAWIIVPIAPSEMTTRDARVERRAAARSVASSITRLLMGVPTLGRL